MSLADALMIVRKPDPMLFTNAAVIDACNLVAQNVRGHAVEWAMARELMKVM